VFGGLCWGIRAVAGEADLSAMLSLCAAGDPPVLISSGFPWAGPPEERLFFVPAPRLPAAAAAAPGADMVSLAVLEYLIGGPAGPGQFAPDIRVHAGRAATAEEIPAGFPPSVESPRTLTARRRAVAAGELHGRTELAFSYDSGWWFLMHVRKPEWADRLRAAVLWTCDTGWGADRSVGKGVAGVEFSDNPLPPDESSPRDRFYNLSEYHPAPAERAHIAARLDSAGYELAAREGVRHRGRPLLMVREGAVLPRPPGAVPGTCPVVSDDGARAWGFAYPVAAG
jgi:hypothetical protein